LDYLEMGSCQSQSVKNDWGVIHNQSNKDLIYILHSTELVDQEALVKKGAGGEMGVDLEKGVNISTTFTIQTQMQAMIS